jgi:branched-chain amino acid transport system ATP-binding protein
MALDIAHRAYLLEEGRIAAEGTPESVFNHPDLRRAYLGIVAQP